MTADNYGLTMVSQNSKTGPMPVTTSNSGTCPPSCPLYGPGGCYGALSHQGINWRAIDAGDRGHSWGDFLKHVATIPRGRLFRHNVSGDLPGAEDRINAKRLRELVKAAGHAKGFTFSHYPITGKHGQHNRRQITAANNAGFTINISYNTIAEAIAGRQARPELPAVTITPLGYWEKLGATSITIDGVKLVQCPKESEGIQCVDCRICSKPKRDVVIAFTPHGSRKKAVDLIACG